MPRTESSHALAAPVRGHEPVLFVSGTGTRGQLFLTPTVRHALMFASEHDALRWCAEQPEHTRHDLELSRFRPLRVEHRYERPEEG